MKTKIIIAILLLVSSYGFYTMKTNSQLESLSCENIEALGNSESGGSHKCVSGGSLKCDGASGYFSSYH